MGGGQGQAWCVARLKVDCEPSVGEAGAGGLGRNVHCRNDDAHPEESCVSFGMSVENTSPSAEAMSEVRAVRKLSSDTNASRTHLVQWIASIVELFN